jgi:hypothetical protein
MADKKISALTAASTPLAGTEVLPIVQSGATVKVATDNLTVKNVRSNATSGILQVVGPAAASTRVMTTPDANFTVAITDAAQSFTGNQTLSTGNLIIGTSGKGIDFSATSGSGTSELLADYEEGTWTPIDTSGAGLTFTVANGFYTKIGREVYAHYYITYPATADGSNNGIGGLPFTSANENAARGGSTLTYHEFNAVTGIYGPKNTAAIQLVNGVGNALTNATCSGKTIMGCIIYFT